MICRTDDWVSLEGFGAAKVEWFRFFLDPPNGIPSHDTFGRVFAALEGKTLRRTFDTASDKAAIHMVSAWASQKGRCLGQVKTHAKSNGITAIPTLLEVLALEGCIVTIDAVGCQKGFAAKICDKEADDLPSLKGNQGLFHDEIKAFLGDAHAAGFRGTPHTHTESTDGDHRRIEVRRVWASNEIGWLADRAAWKDLRSIIVDSERIIGEKRTHERRMFIISLSGEAAGIVPATREHWGIEKCLHWGLDVAMNQDRTRIRMDNTLKNLTILHHLALNMLKQERTARLGIKNKRLASTWDHDYLPKVIGVFLD